MNQDNSKQKIPPLATKNGSSLRIALVGPCSSGKTTLANYLKAQGYDVRQPAQEHSYVPYMWRRISKPDILIFLDIDYANMHNRRPQIGGGPDRLAAQQENLAHARANCDFYLDTSGLTPVEIQKHVLGFLEEQKDKN